MKLRRLLSRASGAFGFCLIERSRLEAEREQSDRRAQRALDLRIKLDKMKARFKSVRRADWSLPAAPVAMLRAALIDRLADTAFDRADRRVTVVVTSCNRHDLLARTLQSLFEHNTYPLTEVIVVEDSAIELDAKIKAAFSAHPMQWIRNRGKPGQIGAIDFAYGQVRTPYIFHLEDDWRFFRPGFIERSFAVLLSEPLCLQVWLRGFREGHSHPMDPQTHVVDGVEWQKVAYDFRDVWHGFSFNPGLRRLRDYRLIGSYGPNIVADGPAPEMQLSELYRRIGYFAAVLSDNHGAGYVRHKGKLRHVTATFRATAKTAPDGGG